jgi:hypothetical protein
MGLIFVETNNKQSNNRPTKLFYIVEKCQRKNKPGQGTVGKGHLHGCGIRRSQVGTYQWKWHPSSGTRKSQVPSEVISLQG